MENKLYKIMSANTDIVINPAIIIPARTTMTRELTEKQVQYCISRGATVYELTIDRGIPVIINTVKPSVAPTVVEPEVRRTIVESPVSEPAVTLYTNELEIGYSPNSRITTEYNVATTTETVVSEPTVTLCNNNESEIVYDTNGPSITTEDVATTTEEVTEPVVEPTEVQEEEQAQEEVQEEEVAKEEIVEEKPQYQNNYTKKNKKNKR